MLVAVYQLMTALVSVAAKDTKAVIELVDCDLHRALCGGSKAIW